MYVLCGGNPRLSLRVLRRVLVIPAQELMQGRDRGTVGLTREGQRSELARININSASEWERSRLLIHRV
jgi:hypothetical protein